MTQLEFFSPYFILQKYLNQNNLSNYDFFNKNRFTKLETDKIKELKPLNHQLIFKLAKATSESVYYWEEIDLKFQKGKTLVFN